MFNILLVNMSHAYKPIVLALRLQKTDGESYYTENGQISIEAGSKVELEIISAELKEGTHIKLTTERMEMGMNCNDGNGSVAKFETPERRLTSNKTLSVVIFTAAPIKFKFMIIVGSSWITDIKIIPQNFCSI